MTSVDKELVEYFNGMFVKLSGRRSGPRHSLYFGDPRMDDIQTVKKWKKVKLSAPNYKESGKHGNIDFRRQSRFSLFPFASDQARGISYSSRHRTCESL